MQIKTATKQSAAIDVNDYIGSIPTKWRVLLGCGPPGIRRIRFAQRVEDGFVWHARDGEARLSQARVAVDRRDPWGLHSFYRSGSDSSAVAVSA